MNMLNKKQVKLPEQQLSQGVEANLYGQNAHGTPQDGHDITIPTGIEPGE